MMITKAALPRRTILRGICASVALPFLDAMVPALSAMAKTAAAPVRRFGAVMAPCGENMFQWTPKGIGTDFELSRILAPLAPFKDQLVLPCGLAHRMAESMGDGNGEHSRAQAVFLNGVHPKLTQGADVAAGVTIDQMIARQIGGETRLPSLEIGLENSFVAGNCDNGYSCVYTNTLAWRTPTTPLPAEHNPRILFERLFGEGGTAAQRLRRIKEDRSVLDSVVGEIGRLERTLGIGDRSRLGQYLDAVREIERRIERAEAQNGESILPPTLERPVGIPDSFDAHAKLMYDLQALAFQTDTTRVFTYLIGREQTNHPYPEIGVPEAHHALSHHGHNPENLEKYAKIGTYHVSQFAYFLDKLRAMPEGDGNVLDNSMILYGSGISDGDQHSHVDLPLLVVGGLTGVKKGIVLKSPEYTPASNLFVALLDKFGLEVDAVGDSTGRLELAPASLSGV